MPERASALVTMLFTDLVGSTELLSRAGDDDAQRIFRAHHDLLAETAAAHGGEEVKWLGDGLMVAFASVADALSAAIAMQQAARRPVAGEHLAIRVGINAGEALRDEADYFGTTVVVARRLCDRAQAGQILCSDVIAALLGGRPGFVFSEVGKLELKGVPVPVGALEVRYETDAAHGLPARLPFVGRESELERLATSLAETAVGRGGLVLVLGDPGIGKTRTTEELADRARREGMDVVWGHCYEGDWAPPYGPFVEVLEALAASTDPGELRADLGDGGAALAQLVPGLRRVLPDLPEAVPLQPDEERFRLIDAMAQFLVARSRRAPLVCCLDDLHWVDHSSVAMLRHVARFSVGQRLLVVGMYRDAEVGPGHPMAEALGALRRDVEYQRVKLAGLEVKSVGQLLEALAEHDVTGAIAAAIAAETDGNPFFIKEVLRLLVEEGRFFRGTDGRWATDRPIADLGIPEGVREVIDRRLSRLSGDANKLLSAAALFEGIFRFDVLAGVAGLDEATALDALDEALAAQLLVPAGGIDVYGFAHTLVRHMLADALSPSRRGRLHLRVAEALEAASGLSLTALQAGEIAGQYHRAAGLAGAERGVEPALAAAARAEATGAHEEAITFLRMALDLLPEADPRRPRVSARLGKALIWALRFDEAGEVAPGAADALAGAEGGAAAATYLAEVAYACEIAGNSPAGWGLAKQGLTYAGDTRDAAWATLYSFDLQRREAEDEEHPGVAIDTPERWEAATILRRGDPDPMAPGPMDCVHASRADALQSTNLAVTLWHTGDLVGALSSSQTEAAAALAAGRFFRAGRSFSFVAVAAAGLGRWDEARRALTEAQALADRVGRPMATALYGQEILGRLAGDDLERLMATCETLIEVSPPGLRWALGFLHGFSASAAAHLGRPEAALAHLVRLLPFLERSPQWYLALPVGAGHAAEVLWLLDRTDHAGRVEALVRDKLLVPDFRSPGTDSRLALARLCALTGRHDEAARWFADAGRVLDEQGARPLRAMADYDEALMYVRRGQRGDTERARPLLDAARARFKAIDMTGWLRRADELKVRLS